jgi:hypothetical protein
MLYQASPRAIAKHGETDITRTHAFFFNEPDSKKNRIMVDVGAYAVPVGPKLLEFAQKVTLDDFKGPDKFDSSHAPQRILGIGFDCDSRTEWIKQRMWPQSVARKGQPIAGRLFEKPPQICRG